MKTSVSALIIITWVVKDFAAWNIWQNILVSASKWFEFNAGSSQNKEPCNLKHFVGSSNPPQIYNSQSSFTFAYFGAAVQRNWTSCNLFSVLE